MAEKLEKNAASSEVVENAEKVVTTEVEISTDTVTYDDDYRYVGETHEEHKVSTTDVVEVPEEEVKSPVETNATESDDDGEPKVEENATEEMVENTTVVEENASQETTPEENACKSNNEISTDEYNALKLKCSSLEKELNEKNEAYNQLEIQCNALAAYKKNKETEIMRNTIECELSKVSKVLNADQINDWREKSLQCSIETVDGFVNELKAFAFDMQEKNGVSTAETMRCSIPTETAKEPTDMWERIAQTYK